MYDLITVDTTATKDITFTTVTKRCMIDSITYVVPGSASEDGDKVYVDEDSVVMEFSAPTSGCFIKPEDGSDKYTFMVLPVRLYN